MPFRIFEFSFGSFLSLYSARQWSLKFVPDLLFFAGLALIFFAVFSFTKETEFPGLNAIIPCLGTALCIHSGQTAKLAQVLRHRVVVAIGLISYSLYLVQWPIVVFYKSYIQHDVLNSLESTAIVGASLAAATALYFMVEKSFRSKTADARLFLFAVLSSVLLLAGMGFLIQSSHGWNSRSLGPRTNQLGGYRSR